MLRHAFGIHGKEVVALVTVEGSLQGVVHAVLLLFLSFEVDVLLVFLEFKVVLNDIDI